jgi:hypothetical protein
LFRFLVLFELQEFWKLFPFFLEQSGYVFQHKQSQRLQVNKVYFTTEQAEWNSLMINESLIHFLFPKLKQLISLPPSFNHQLQGARKKYSSDQTSSLTSSNQQQHLSYNNNNNRFMNTAQAANNYPNNNNNTTRSMVKRQTPSLIKRIPSNSVEPNGNNPFLNTGNNNSQTTTLLSVLNNIPSQQQQPIIPQQFHASISMKSPSSETFQTAPPPPGLNINIPPRPPSQAAEKGMIKRSNTTPVTRTVSSSQEKKIENPSSPQFCPPSPSTSINSFTNLSLLSNPTNTQSNTPLPMNPPKKTSGQKKLNKFNLQVHETEFQRQHSVQTSGNSTNLKTSPMHSHNMKTPIRQRSCSITDTSLNSVRTQLFLRNKDYTKEGHHSSNRKPSMDETTKIIPNNKEFLLQSMEHAFWQRHRYLHEIHVFMYSNISRVILTNINEMVHQSCMSLIHEITQMKKEKKFPVFSKESANQHDEFLTNIQKKTFFEVLDRSNKFFQELYTNAVKVQLLSLYNIHSVDASVKQLSVYYTTKQLYSLFTNRKEYFRDYCTQKLQQVVEKLGTKNIFSENNNYQDESNNVLNPLQRQASTDSVVENGSITNLGDNSLSFHNYLTSLFSNNNGLVDRFFLNLDSGDYNIKTASFSTRFQIPAFPNVNELMIFITSFSTLIIQFIEILFPLLQERILSVSQHLNMLSPEESLIFNFLEKFFRFLDQYKLLKEEEKQVYLSGILLKKETYHLIPSSTIASFYYSLINAFFRLVLDINNTVMVSSSSELTGKISCEMNILLAISVPFLFASDYYCFIQPNFIHLLQINDLNQDISQILNRITKLFSTKNSVDVEEVVNKNYFATVQSHNLVVENNSFLSSILQLCHGKNAVLSLASMQSLLEILTRKKILAFYENCKGIHHGQQIISVMLLMFFGQFSLSVARKEYPRKSESIISVDTDGVEVNEKIEFLKQFVGKEICETIENFFISIAPEVEM